MRRGVRLLLQLALAAADAATNLVSLASADAPGDSVLFSADGRAITMPRRVLPVERVVRRRRRRVCRR